jgi:hypothetical protein
VNGDSSSWGRIEDVAICELEPDVGAPAPGAQIALHEFLCVLLTHGVVEQTGIAVGVTRGPVADGRHASGVLVRMRHEASNCETRLIALVWASSVISVLRGEARSDRPPLPPGPQ